MKSLYDIAYELAWLAMFATLHEDAHSSVAETSRMEESRIIFKELTNSKRRTGMIKP